MEYFWWTLFFIVGMVFGLDILFLFIAPFLALLYSFRIIKAGLKRYKKSDKRATFGEWLKCIFIAVPQIYFMILTKVFLARWHGGRYHVEKDGQAVATNWFDV